MKIFSKKSQSAMEYLMTYGWAILIILIAVGALFYLGVFSPSTPSTCTATAPITCADIKATATDSTIEIVLGATGTQTANIVGGTGLIISDVLCTYPGDLTISTTSPTSKQWTACSGLSSGDKFSGTLAVTYTLEGSTIVHNTNVQFSGTVE